MSTSARTPLYDLFKLIVAIILLLVFLFLIWLRPSPSPLPQPPTATATPVPATTVTPTILTEPPSPTATAPTSTVVPPVIPSPAGTATPTPTATPTETAATTATSTSLPPPTESPVPEPLPTPIVEIPSDTSACEAVSQSRLQVGMKARILRRLNFRSSPGIRNNWIKTNLPGTQVEVVGEPTCTRYKNGGAYLWWQIKLPDGQIGWSAEASAFGRFYFMEPVP